MSSTTEPQPADRDADPEELSDRELLERLAEYDPERIPIASDARRALERLDQDSDGGEP